VDERNAFLKLLAKNEDDTTTRLVYADWLDEHGEHEEADRQRKWPTAKAWLVKFCEENNPPDDEETDEWIIDYATLIELGQEAVERAGEDGELWFSCGNNMGMCDALRDNSEAFWDNWCIVTGITIPPDVEDNGGFSCAC
jgi:uncharacterized protein (TIGR02996 family)